MPRTSKIKKYSNPPEGYSKIEPTIEKYKLKLKKATTTTSQATTKQQSQWELYRIIHQITKYIYELHKDKKINDSLYQWLILQDYCDKNLISKWRKRGYEKLCCLNCINGENICICRVPKFELLKKDETKDKIDIECINCGCRGCASTD
ncbi:BUD31 [Candida pseudojiufengensis]|uniref:BUD31 n=1 Tax=Candida pseudojiufengensis TaxID=497109 RepID=UPI0022242510|nr:BUD31 [Candida pseudojiufengensis]KAI5963507.1 BUD31 [Candida pseudojiufengensis]